MIKDSSAEKNSYLRRFLQNPTEGGSTNKEESKIENPPKKKDFQKSTS